MHKGRLTFGIIILLMAIGCSRTTLNIKSNNWRTRTYHNMTSKYNIYFNGNEAYSSGLEKIEDQNKDDFSRVIPIFEDGIHENYSGSKADMDFAIEKANKIIQLHSIKKRPDYNPRKGSDPEYRAWRSQEEFNKMIDDAYLLMAKATFYKGEFMASIGIFNYVALKYPGEDAWYEAQLWIARAYLEMDWLYEAENILILANDDKLPYTQLQLFNSVSADYQIKRGAYKEALPFLKSALDDRIKKQKALRYRFILAQIYQTLGESDLAYDSYKRVIRSVPSYEMEFFSRIRMTEVMAGNDAPKAIKKLKKMLKDPKNLEYKGQIYYALGNTHKAANNHQEAIENYRLSLAFSQGVQQGLTSTTIANLYYQEEEYAKAHPYYATASSTLPADYPKVDQVNYRTKALTKLVSLYQVMGEQDRTYRLAQMSEKERDAYLKKEEKERVHEEKILALIAEANGESEKEMAIEESRSTKVGDWYFFNENLVEEGKKEFRKLWGERPLRDNWRRSMNNDFESPEELSIDDVELINENADNGEPLLEENTQTTNDIDSIENTVEPIETRANESDKAIIDAYFDLAILFQFDINNLQKAIATYEALEAQYPHNAHSPDSYFAIYNAAKTLGDQEKTEEAKMILLREYPNSNYALILSDPNAKHILLEDNKAYNTLYEETFKLFLKGENNTVLENTKRLKSEFRDSTLMAKVLFMDALATAKLYPEEDIKPQLNTIIDNYPQDTIVNEQALIVLKQLEAGKKITIGGSAANTLSERRNESERLAHQKLLQERQYLETPDTRHYFVFVLPDSLQINKNQLQYEVAKFNFNKFMTMDFDLTFAPLNKKNTLLIINGFVNKEQGEWYKNQFLSTSILDKFPDIRTSFIISEENFRLMLLLGTVDEFQYFDLKLSSKKK